MTIPNFEKLLNDALEGKKQALSKLSTYRTEDYFEKNEISQAIKAFAIYQTSNNLTANLKKKSYALYLRGLWYQYGIGGPADQSRAIEFYKQAIKLDNSYAMVERARLLSQQWDFGYPVNWLKAIELYERADNLGHPLAKFELEVLRQGGKVSQFMKMLAGTSISLILEFDKDEPKPKTIFFKPYQSPKNFAYRAVTVFTAPSMFAIEAALDMLIVGIELLKLVANLALLKPKEALKNLSYVGVCILATSFNLLCVLASPIINLVDLVGGGVATVMQGQDEKVAIGNSIGNT